MAKPHLYPDAPTLYTDTQLYTQRLRMAEAPANYKFTVDDLYTFLVNYYGLGGGWNLYRNDSFEETIKPADRVDFYAGTDIEILYDQSQNRLTFNATGDYDNYNGWDVWKDGVLQESILSGDKLDFVGGSNIDITYNAANNRLTFDANGIVDNYVNSINFNTSTGDLTLGRTGSLPDLVENLDGRYVTTDSDNQTLSISGNTLSISGGNSVNLPFDNYNGWRVYTQGNNRELIGSGDKVDFYAGSNMAISYNSSLNRVTFSASDDQTLSISGNTLSISGGNSVTIPSFWEKQSGQDKIRPISDRDVAIGNIWPSAPLHVSKPLQTVAKFERSNAFGSVRVELNRATSFWAFTADNNFFGLEDVAGNLAVGMKAGTGGGNNYGLIVKENGRWGTASYSETSYNSREAKGMAGFVSTGGTPNVELQSMTPNSWAFNRFSLNTTASLEYSSYILTSSSTRTLTLPTSSSWEGKVLYIGVSGSGTLVLDPTSGLIGGQNIQRIGYGEYYKAMVIMYDGSTWNIISSHYIP